MSSSAYCFLYILPVILLQGLVQANIAKDTCSSTGAFKVITELLSYKNSKCILADSTSFLQGEDCPVKIHVFLDGFEPDAPQKLVPNDIEYTEFLSTSETELVFLPVQTGARLIARDFCDQQFKGANLRVIILRADGNDLVNSYSCKVPESIPTPRHEDSSWSAITSCIPAVQLEGMSLSFRYQVQESPLSQCCLS